MRWKIWRRRNCSLTDDSSRSKPRVGSDAQLIEEARRLGAAPRLKEGSGVSRARQYVKRRKPLRILDAFGTLDFDPKCDHKVEGRRRRR